MARLWRAFHPELPAEAGAEVELSAEEAHHVGRVLRLGPGESLSLFDGAGREWEARILAAPRPRIVVRLERECVEPVDAPLDLRLYQGLCRSERMDWLVQKATEIGVSAIHPLPTTRSEPARKLGQRLERWRRIAVEAAKQCGRRTLPEIAPRDELPAAGCNSRAGRWVPCWTGPLRAVSGWPSARRAASPTRRPRAGARPAGSSPNWGRAPCGPRRPVWSPPRLSSTPGEI